MTKYVFVTGGVVSGLGKGITAAFLGRLLKSFLSVWTVSWQISSTQKTSMPWSEKSSIFALRIGS